MGHGVPEIEMKDDRNFSTKQISRKKIDYRAINRTY